MLHRTMPEAIQGRSHGLKIENDNQYTKNKPVLRAKARVTIERLQYPAGFSRAPTIEMFYRNIPQLA